MGVIGQYELVYLQCKSLSLADLLAMNINGEKKNCNGFEYLHGLESELNLRSN